jgi:negative regulator of replication initiation
MGEVYLPETPEMIALLEQIQRDKEELAEIREALARFPQSQRDQVAARNQVAAEDVPLLERLQEVARMPEKVSMRQFHELIKNDLEYEESKGVERFLALWETYLQYHAESSQAPHHWSGVGPVSYNAPASRGSVVDAVFAKLGA